MYERNQSDAADGRAITSGKPLFICRALTDDLLKAARSFAAVILTGRSVRIINYDFIILNG